jgi:hypothetical protein
MTKFLFFTINQAWFSQMKSLNTTVVLVNGLKIKTIQINNRDNHLVSIIIFQRKMIRKGNGNLIIMK